jgi:hypothetical protein
MVLGYLKGILKGWVGGVVTPIIGSMDFIGTIGAIGTSLIRLW